MIFTGQYRLFPSSLARKSSWLVVPHTTKRRAIVREVRPYLGRHVSERAVRNRFSASPYRLPPRVTAKPSSASTIHALWHGSNRSASPARTSGSAADQGPASQRTHDVLRVPCGPTSTSEESTWYPGSNARATAATHARITARDAHSRSALSSHGTPGITSSRETEPPERRFTPSHLSPPRYPVSGSTSRPGSDAARDRISRTAVIGGTSPQYVAPRYCCTAASSSSVSGYRPRRARSCSKSSDRLAHGGRTRHPGRRPIAEMARDDRRGSSSTRVLRSAASLRFLRPVFTLRGLRAASHASTEASRAEPCAGAGVASSGLSRGSEKVSKASSATTGGICAASAPSSARDARSAGGWLGSSDVPSD